MSRSRLRRRIVRVDPALHEALTKLAERLFSETRSEYSRSAVTRGVTALGLVALARARGRALLCWGALPTPLCCWLPWSQFYESHQP